MLRALPILVFADTDIADIFFADTGTDIPDNRYFLGRYKHDPLSIF